MKHLTLVLIALLSFCVIVALPQQSGQLTWAYPVPDTNPPPAGDPKELTFDAAVEVVERLGSEILLDVAVGTATMVASVEPTATAKVHEKLRLAVNPGRVHFFDNETEAAI